MTDALQELLDVPLSTDEQFEYLWQNHPRRLGSKGVKDKGRKSYEKALKAGATYDDFLAAQVAYTKMCRAQGIVGTSYVQMATTWLNSGYKAEIEPDPTDGLIERLRDL